MKAIQGTTILFCKKCTVVSETLYILIISRLYFLSTVIVFCLSLILWGYTDGYESLFVYTKQITNTHYL